jgi:hypothetical protein
MQERVGTVAVVEKESKPFRMPNMLEFANKVRSLLYAAFSPIVEAVGDLGKPGVRKQTPPGQIDFTR